ncbi:NAD(P)-binding protein [Trametopsis cervina]|nr:NAD(P)-binding protein [Trametopsis cervina]
MSGQLVLLTGISGFIGSYIAHSLLQEGYRVRGVTRSIKVDAIQARYKDYGSKVDIVGVDDLPHGSFEDALKGVDAVVHAAASLPGRSSTEEALKVAIDGSTNILRQSEAAGIHNFVLISSIVALTNWKTQDFVTDKDWNSITLEEAVGKENNSIIVYFAAKTLSERAVWDFVDKHPHVEVAAINPVFVYGPFAPEFDIPDGRFFSLSTNSQVYSLFRADLPLTYGIRWVDVRDVATAVLRSLTAPPTSEVGRKRFIMSGDPWPSAKEVAEYIAEARPELKERISPAALEAGGPAVKSIVDTSRAKEVLGLKFTDWKDTILSTVDSLLAFEKEWKAKGLTVQP